MSVKSKRGMTIIELLVVIGIIGVLAGVLISTFGGAGDSARAAQCMTNMRNLAVAAQNLGMSENHFPIAGDYEIERDTRDGTVYYMNYGWISGYESTGLKRQTDSIDTSVGQTESHIKSVTPLSCYTEDDVKSLYAITNGSLWTFVGHSASSYRCPDHEALARKKDLKLRWSYAVNGAFGFSENGETKLGSKSFGSLPAPDRTLLFAEIPFVVRGSESAKTPENRSWGAHSEVTFSTAASDAAVNTVLEYDGSGAGAKESIGFNHKSTQKRACAHVCFADGHVAKLTAPASASDTELVRLTKWLCEGKSVVFDGSTWSLASGETED